MGGQGCCSTPHSAWDGPFCYTQIYPVSNVSDADVINVPALSYCVFGNGIGKLAEAYREETDPEKHCLPQLLRPRCQRHRSPSTQMVLGDCLASCEGSGDSCGGLGCGTPSPSRAPEKRWDVQQVFSCCDGVGPQVKAFWLYFLLCQEPGLGEVAWLPASQCYRPRLSLLQNWSQRTVQPSEVAVLQKHCFLLCCPPPPDAIGIPVTK